MTTSALPDILTDILKKEPIPKDTIGYLIARTKLRLHDFMLRRLAAETRSGQDCPALGGDASTNQPIDWSSGQLDSSVGDEVGRSDGR
jgi:hypothetical protein